VNLEHLNTHKKFYYSFILLLLLSLLSQSQPDSLFFKAKDDKLLIPTWTVKKEAGLLVNQVSFTNWNAGGVNSISATIYGRASANYKYKYMFWNSSINARYGINTQENTGLRKTDDIIEIISSVGYQSDTLSNWYGTARFSFATQFSNGFNYPDTSTPISQFMAPGYLFFGLGAEYGKQIKHFSLYMSPLTLKATFVLDQRLANSGAFGVEPAVLDQQGNIIRRGKRLRREFGFLLNNTYEFEPYENIKVRNILSLYSDYINSFGNIDVDWEMIFDFKVNSYMKATFISHLRYDNDIKITNVIDEENSITEEGGAKLQWRQLLGIGVAIDF
jgi:hypothetical protein